MKLSVIDCIPSPSLRWFSALLMTVLCLQPASGQLALEFGDPITLLPVSDFIFQPNEVRTIAVLVNNTGSTERLSGETMELGIGGGGVGLGGVAGPVFTSADLITGTPFAGDHGSPTVNGGPNPFPGTGTVPQYLGLSLTTTSSAVSPETVGAVNLASGRSLLATLTVSAAGFTTAQTWDLQFFGAGSFTFFNGSHNELLTPTFEDSTVSVVPEPSGWALIVGLGLAGFVLGRRRFRSAPSGSF